MELTLLVTTSPRTTVLWAPTVDDAVRLRADLDTAGLFWRPSGFDGDPISPLATDVEIGADAMSACEMLAGAGYAFRWHPDQHPLNCRATLFGLPIEPQG